MTNERRPASLTGRVAGSPDALWLEEVLRPQFEFEVTHLLPAYVLAEKTLLVEYRHLGVLTADEVRAVADALSSISPHALAADPVADMSDICFAVERFVTDRLTTPVPAWHLDRSRNDIQACAQLLFGRDRTLDTVADMLALVRTVHRMAGRHLGDPMPGYTHLQAAQVITPAFFLTALSAYLLRAVRRLLATYRAMNLSPLGSGAMAGQELAWDRRRMADLLGFAGPEPHALVGVAARTWTLEVSGELSTFGVVVSRFLTDLMAWSGNEYRFVELPDELAGISSAMPQKKNYPILERIRGRTAHLTAAYLDISLAQRNTPYSNTVEVTKEGGITRLEGLFAAFSSTMRLFTAVLANLRFDTARMRELCEREFLGGFTLANVIARSAPVPWRRAQVIAGEYIVAMRREGRSPREADTAALASIAKEHGYDLTLSEPAVAGVFSPEANLLHKVSAGSANPAAVRELMAADADELAALESEWRRRRSDLDAVGVRIDEQLKVGREA
jgi:argininosuccinate lyase